MYEYDGYDDVWPSDAASRLIRLKQGLFDALDDFDTLKERMCKRLPAASRRRTQLRRRGHQRQPRLSLPLEHYRVLPESFPGRGGPRGEEAAHKATSRGQGAGAPREH